MRIALAVGATFAVLATTSQPHAMLVAVEARSVCEIWDGQAVENDGPDTVRMKLCRDPKGGVTGDVLYSSPVSGYSVRAVEGSWQGAKLILHETRFTDYHAANGWTHCLMDAYDLARTAPNVLTGSGASKSCGDTNTKYELHKRPPPRKPAPAPAP